MESPRTTHKGKARAAPCDDEDSATAPLTGRDAQWQAGVRRHALPDAHLHQVAASQKAAEKRTVLTKKW